ncbi:MAG: metal ABC transporter permease [Candidatus Krumholzibacteriia bacterium]
MGEFLRALADLPFLRQALLAGLATSVTAGVIGSLVVTRRMATAAGGLAHAVLGGMGIAYWLSTARGVSGVHPMHGALVAAVICALVLARSRAQGKERDDTTISVLWALGMAVGVLFLARTPGYRSDLMGYLLGNILLVDPVALRWLLGLDLATVVVLWLFHDQIIATSFDPEFARLRGLDVGLWEAVILVLVAVTVVSLVYVVGIVMVIALLTLPAATASRFTTRMFSLMIGAVVLSALITTGGLALSYRWDLPTGAVDVLVAVLIYLLALAVDRPAVRRRLPGGV